MEFVKCCSYLAVIGVAAFFLGRLFAGARFRADRFPFRRYAFEESGAFYRKIRIRFWQGRLPDMSRLLPSLMPPKRMDRSETSGQLERMIRETCIAESTHVLLCVMGLRCLQIWPGTGGRVLCALYAAGNFLFILVQRYNRPRLVRLHSRMETVKTGAYHHEGLNLNQ